MHQQALLTVPAQIRGGGGGGGGGGGPQTDPATGTYRRRRRGFRCHRADRRARGQVTDFYRQNRRSAGPALNLLSESGDLPCQLTC